MKAFDKERFFKQQDEIRRILMSKWDPIGVSDTPEAADEYDMYTGAIHGMLLRNASNAELTAHLLEIETKRMGLTDLKGNPLLPAELRSEAVAALQHLKNFWS